MGRASIVDARAVSGPAKGIVGEEPERLLPDFPSTGTSAHCTYTYVSKRSITRENDCTCPRNSGQ